MKILNKRHITVTVYILEFGLIPWTADRVYKGLVV